MWEKLQEAVLVATESDNFENQYMLTRDTLQQKYHVNDEQIDSVLFLTELLGNAEDDGRDAQHPNVITTHCAHIVLSESRVYKIKRAVKYSYLDMLRLSDRETLCKRELELNKPTLPGIYLEVLPIKKDNADVISLNGNGETIEWVLVMERFDENKVLDNMARNGTLSTEIAKDVGEAVYYYHAHLPSIPVNDGYKRINEIVLELVDELGDTRKGFDRHLLRQFKKQSIALVNSHKSLLDARASEGYIKRCHGDLHLRNIVLMDDGPHPFDALEFDERMATIDVLYDLAFVLMDLSHRNLNEQQNTLLNKYLAHCEPQYFKGLALLPLFLMCRAGIRAMTAAQSVHNNGKPPIEASQYLELALSYMVPNSSMLIAVGGYSGSGKSTISTQLAVKRNAILLSSDVERKAQQNIAETQHLHASEYTEKSAQLNYQRLADKTHYALTASQTVVVDATFLSNDQRTAIQQVASHAHVPFCGIWLDVPSEILEARIRNRARNASDATESVLQKQLQRKAGNIKWQKIDASDSIAATLDRIEICIANSLDQTKPIAKENHH